jgi:DHA1 family tetracycline resistance protein-like MFS transporter
MRTPTRGALFTIFLIVLADLMGFGLIIALLPFYAKQYNASDFQVGLIFSIYSICQLVGSPVLGLMSDRFGRRPVLILSQLGSVAGYLILAYATYYTWANPAIGIALVYASRVIDGFSGGNISTAQAYIADVTQSKDRAKSMGLLGAAFGIGFTVGPAIGGLLGHYHAWWPAIAAAAMSGVAAFLTFVKLPESRTHVPSEGALWLHPSRFAPVLKNSTLVQMMLIFFLSMMAFVMMESTFAIFCKDVMGYGPREVGYLFGMAGLIIILIQGGLMGRLTRALGEWTLVIVGPLLVTAAMLVYAEVGWRPMLALLLVGGLFNAVGRSFQTPALSSLISKHADPSLQGTTFGLNHMLGSLARVLGPIIATAVYTAHHTSPYLLAGAITLVVTVWTIALRARENESRTVAAFDVLPAATEPSE